MLRFEKWEGLGNDFILLEEELSPEQVRRLCDRHRGVGADGVIAVEAIQASRCRMIVHNADGSRPEMCGNGLRCVAAYVADRGASKAGAVVVLTDAGERLCRPVRQSEGRYRVSASMGVAEVGGVLETPAHVGATGRPFRMVRVGNPHAVSFAPFVSEDVEELGRAVDQLVEGGANVELCKIGDGGRQVEVSVWERGVGLTEACGTGACAVVAAAAGAGQLPFDEPIDVVLAGGVLEITVARDSWALTMVGPARRVFVGETLV
ncbi:MAG: diaminopimelate epimerase [Deltaproteobacteria bacterium]|nr:MAG: diaminopimelate epimerase [Deltaproteobacteria bacterium]